MSGYDLAVYENVCKVHGHHISTYTNRLIDPGTKQAMDVQEFCCASCGMSLEEIRQQKKKARAPRSKAAPVEAPTT